MVPKPGGDDTEAVKKLTGLLERLKAQETLHPSPFFGKLTRQQWLQLHLGHCSHHLGFLVPKS
ncbi:MAG: DUF1569 domain-containing protein [Fuerstiella sp.]|nr:DUF1569 domain-containing protein [Fuerstiella sp.]